MRSPKAVCLSCFAPLSPTIVALAPRPPQSRSLDLPRSAMRLCVSLLLQILGISPLFAGQPAWWTNGSTQIIDSNASHEVGENYGPANLGQLKNVAKKAKLYLDGALRGKSGMAIDAMVAGFSTTDVSENYAPVNLGQLKAVAKPFYDRLLSVGYDTRANLVAHGYPSNWSSFYPWNPGTAVSENYAPANIGQLKMAFSFDLGGMAPAILVDSDSNGLPDWWETSVAGGNSGGATGDWNGDGIRNVTELISALTTANQGQLLSSDDIICFTQLY